MDWNWTSAAAFILSSVQNLQHRRSSPRMTPLYISEWLYPNSGSASFGGAFEGQLCHNAAQRLSYSECSSRCSFFSLFLEDELLRSFVASHIPRFFGRPKNKKEREKMATSCGVDRHCCEPEWQKCNQKMLQRLDRHIQQQLTRLTRSLWRTRLGSGPMKDADPELGYSQYLPRAAVLHLSTRCPGTPTWLPHPPAHLFTRTHLSLILSSVLQCL